jgi:hypothetical protein
LSSHDRIDLLAKAQLHLNNYIRFARPTTTASLSGPHLEYNLLRLHLVEDVVPLYGIR